ncbi:major allergen I polypeptide chain 1-like [Mesocricetus auratus]|uniref:Major allergen I polypeptide chain 1-like n=1 Tax=Mesocricetus auratus TaxID=10036 RepID=A0ABM2WLV5_MESAU|nr:major allergen I polypeptide chain 1-like [Mesocricetus auratus]
MKLHGALTMLGAALLLTSGGDCGICPTIKEELELFLGPSGDAYINFVKKYKDDNATLENAENLKTCEDNKLTEEDKESVCSLLLQTPLGLRLISGSRSASRLLREGRPECDSATGGRARGASSASLVV